MTQSARDLENTFERAIDLLVHNWVLIVPGLILAVASALIQAFVSQVVFAKLVITGNGSADALYAMQAFVSIVVFVIAMSISVVQMAFVTGMSGGAWQHGRTSLRDGWDALTHRAAPIALAFILLMLIGICATVLSQITFFVPIVACAVFFIYTMAAVVIGGKAPIEGIVESAQTALSNFLPTLAVVALIGLLAFVGGWLGSLLSHFSSVTGWFVAGVLQQLIVAYASLVIAGEYLKLTGRPVGS
jgi:hypothetical protein